MMCDRDSLRKFARVGRSTYLRFWKMLYRESENEETNFILQKAKALNLLFKAVVIKPKRSIVIYIAIVIN